MQNYEEGELVDKSACGEKRADLKKCLLESDCCKKVIFTHKKKKFTHNLNNFFGIFF